MLKRFIERPVLSTVVSIIIVTLGIIGLVTLPISQYPDIAPPTIQVQTSYSGANADVVLKSVIVPLEQQINGVENMDYITSTAGNDGSANITVSFKIGSDPNMAAVNVQNAVARANPQLPQDVVRSGVTVQKKQTSNLLIFSIYSTNPSFDQTFLQNYADINITPVIKRIPGVGDASASGNMDYSMRIWLNSQAMASYGLVPADITAALAEQNIQAAPGQFGESGGQSFQYVIKYPGTLIDTTQFGNIVLRSNLRSRLLRLKDVARIELGALSYFNSTRTNGYPAVSISVAQVAGSNARDVITQTLKVMEDASKSFPNGVKYVVLQNVDWFLSASIEKVLHTLFEAFILVFIVVFLFLQDLRSTLIPAISVPVAIVGTFFFLKLFGFTINLLTLFALILAIGIVVDDAIVIVEAVHARLDQGASDARQASIDALDEISSAIISITLVMSAVFIPVSFITGSSGVFYKQFGLTLATSIILSAINALTLSPALCALFLKPHDDKHKKQNFLQRFYTAFNVGFERVTKKYTDTLSFFSKHKWLPVAILVLFSAGLVILAKTTPTGFVPEEDLGTINCNISLPPGASLQRTDVVTRRIESLVKTIPEINNVLAVTGRGQLSGTGSNYGMVVMRLIPWDQRTRTIQQIIKELNQKTANFTEAEVKFFAPGTIQGFGASNGFAFQLQDKTGGDIAHFYKVGKDFLNVLNEQPEIQFATTSFNPNFAQYLMEVNVPKIKDAGLKVTDITSAMQGYYGGIYASNFNQFGQQYRVMVQASPEYRTTPETMNGVFVRTADGVMVPITEFVTLSQTYGPQSITRFNLFNSISINGTPNPAYSSGEAIAAIQRAAAEALPPGFGYEFSGITREELSGNKQTIYIFLLCLIFVYLLLSAQYESYILPLAILLTIPVGIFGAFLFAKLFGISNNIYVQITFIMLIGLLAKNAILIVEYAVERRRAGMSIPEAAINGAKARLRPILMTSFAFILGLIPLMIATGAGANGNRSIGTGAVGGMLIGTVFGIFITPTLFILFQLLQEKVKRPKAVKIK
ncbi:hydrophobic/amphiphilic exporter-1, HAE1 family [Chitinophaga terrae (ex Kim and Jung 2007)]|uniref:Hydrophobic/amphiphilic exporter-1, HAE1 family n=1 Tax=Chitinophaga terrae (ex Kim and Jung 2007) TaxID=408074 RepID=A0A1H4BAU7_9BACT|nr:efflux RND transporter permease subunit [Chitinophaga terrae (ex Kim and Jung 2007)]MDQ0106250.1 HAE1 family hydrophobic/amphiphilic exporter-1 [Chitinophaga terrae (ex Kim and Jung 2007)]GEP92110.1 multidrug transporter AcrB [Chitinophaga terrae (ex Kim and Jung 2007)]SEA45226.1 hydrophobic/amphiphilic exporter-1, HAE1 family [Chitinophaga terrae (ex Kim and Jung 2007)]